MENVINQLILWSKELKVLYVEDDIALREEVSIFLSDIFGDIDVAKDGKEGLDKILTHTYDIVITDIRMPIMNGIEMIEHIKEHLPHQPILVTSAHNEVEYLVKLIDLGVDSFITKPLQVEQIFHVLYKIVERIHEKKELENSRIALEDANAKLKKLTSIQSKSLDLKSALLKSYQEALQKACIVSITDTQGVIKDVNENFCLATGYSKEDVIGKTHNIISSPLTDRSVYKELWERISQKEVWQGYLINQTKTLTPLHHYTTIVPIVNNEGVIVEYVAIIQDLTELYAHQKEQVSCDLEQALKLKDDELLKHIPFASALMHNDFTIQARNKAFEGLILNHNNPSLLGKMTSATLCLKEVVSFEEMDYNESIESIYAQWPYAGDITCKGIVSSIHGFKEIFMTITPFHATSLYLVCLTYVEDYELCCQVLER